MPVQRFQLILSGRRPTEDPLLVARKVFADLKGCEVIAATAYPSGLNVTLGLLNLTEDPFPSKAIQDFGGIATEPRGYTIISVRPILTGNLTKTVSAILDRKSQPPSR